MSDPGLSSEQYEAERAIERKSRIRLLQAYRNRLVAAMKSLKPKGASWQEVTAGIRMVTVELRAEYRHASSADAIAPSELQSEPIPVDDPLAGLKLFPLERNADVETQESAPAGQATGRGSATKPAPQTAKQPAGEPKRKRG